jgi:hypothetical protein
MARLTVSAAVINQIAHAEEHKDADRNRIKEVIKAALPNAKPTSAGNNNWDYNLCFRKGDRDGARWILNMYDATNANTLTNAFRALPDNEFHCPILIRYRDATEYSHSHLEPFE